MARFVLVHRESGVDESADRSVGFRAVRKGGFVDLTIGETSPDQTSKLVNVHAVYAKDPIPETADAPWFFANGQHHGTALPDDLTKGGDITISVPAVLPGTYFVQVIAEYEDVA